MSRMNHFWLLMASLLFSPGCTQLDPPRYDLTFLQPCCARQLIHARLGEPSRSVEWRGNLYDIYAYFDVQRYDYEDTQLARAAVNRDPTVRLDLEVQRDFPEPMPPMYEQNKSSESNQDDKQCHSSSATYSQEYLSWLQRKQAYDRSEYERVRPINEYRQQQYEVQYQAAIQEYLARVEKLALIGLHPEDVSDRAVVSFQREPLAYQNPRQSINAEPIVFAIRYNSAQQLINLTFAKGHHQARQQLVAKIKPWKRWFTRKPDFVQETGPSIFSHSYEAQERASL
jgi:hypothetical protein